MKDFEKLLDSPYSRIVMLDLHVAQLKPVFEFANRRGKRLLLHADLIHGLSNDAYGAEYLCQEFRPYGILSTKSSVILKAKEKGVLAIQRMFVIDNGALATTAKLLEKTKPDYVEALPAAMLGTMLEESGGSLGCPILAGGFIRSVDDVETALRLGAITVTTSNKTLWKHYAGQKRAELNV